MKDYGIDCAIRCCSDSSVAVGVVERTGIGRVRHLQTQYLWVRELASNGKISIHKVGTNSNLADLLIKYLDSDKIQEHLQRIGIYDVHNRPANAPKTIGNVEMHVRGRYHPAFKRRHFGRSNYKPFVSNSYNNTGNNITSYNNNSLDRRCNSHLDRAARVAPIL